MMGEVLEASWQPPLPDYNATNTKAKTVLALAGYRKNLEKESAEQIWRRSLP